jgi:hypothetical protein
MKTNKPLVHFPGNGLCCAVLSTIVTTVLLTPQTTPAADLTVPPEFEFVDANSVYAEDPPPASGARFQEVYAASYFTNMLTGPGVLVRMANRPDRLVKVPRTVTLIGYELWLSTTQRGPGNLSSRFDDNLGLDNTLVFSGDLTWSTQGEGPAQGPRAFDYVITFQHPFVYDPGKGNLLVEWRVANSPEGRPAIDAQLYSDGKIRLLFGGSTAASVASFSNAGLAVRRMTIEPFHLTIQNEPDSFKLSIIGPPGWSGRVQRSSDLGTWTDWFPLTFEELPFQTNDLSPASAQQQFYRLVMP